ncbi:hypothetical protein FAES_3650 [Fibrella aestuarina BUZ 2]|uniref:Uncharacterized protein n=1 Tax=Fibrella aestuarina BUZ 2 TaxID=1166018 RepID=I0KC04_9BACT|nr:hypothetical protein [Fibrella aestuarina]CCH01657.1 hypothetical protein FAES_3650 [Fibrella aestuarina BUZ 2]
MTLTEIIAAYGAYYLRQGQNATRLLQMARRKLESEELFTIIVTDETVYQAAESTYGRLVQAYQSKFTPIDPLGFKPRGVAMHHLKVDTKVTPHDLESTWLGFLASDDVNPETWPLIRWLLEQKVIPQIDEDLELLEIGKGVRVEPTSGVVSDAGKSMNGYLTIQNTETTAGNMPVLTMGAIPTTSDADVVLYFQDFADMIRKDYWKKAMTIVCSEENERRFARGLDDVYGLRPNTDVSVNTLRVPKTNLLVKGYASMGTSNRLWCSPKENCISLRKKTQNQQIFDMQVAGREVNMLTDFYRGVGYLLPYLCFRSDQN